MLSRCFYENVENLYSLSLSLSLEDLFLVEISKFENVDFFTFYVVRISLKI